MSTALSRASVLAHVNAMKTYQNNAGVPEHKYLSFNAQTGAFVARETGKPEIQISIGKTLAFNWPEISHGYVCWKDGKPVNQISFKMSETPVLPPMEDLPDHGPYVVDATRTDGWKEQTTLVFKDLQNGHEYLFKTGPASAVSAVARFIGSFRQDLMTRAEGLAEGEDLDSAPMVMLGRTHFVPKGRTNKVYVPSFALVDNEPWKKFDELAFAEVKIKYGEYSARDDEEPEDDGEEAAATNAKVIDAEIEE